MGSMIYTSQSSGRKKPRKKTESIKAAEKALQETLARVGYKGNSSTVRRPYKHDSGIVRHSVATSDQIPGNGSKRESNKYTGDEIIGIALMHKQAYTPVRRDNKKSATEISQMRRN